MELLHLSLRPLRIDLHHFTAGCAGELDLPGRDGKHVVGRNACRGRKSENVIREGNICSLLTIFIPQHVPDMVDIYSRS
jgi:hypothetical protein